MVEAFYSRLDEIIKNSGFKNIRQNVNHNEITIVPSLINIRTEIDFCLICLAAYATYNVQDKDFYLIPKIVYNLAALVVVCCDLNSLNKVKIAFDTRHIQIRNRVILNRLFLKYLLRKKDSYEFKEIKAVVVRCNGGFGVGILRYFIDLKLRDDSSRVLLSFSNEDQADKMATVLRSVLKF